MQIPAFSGQFKFTGTDSISQLVQAVHYVVPASAGSFRFTGQAVKFKRKQGGKGQGQN